MVEIKWYDGECQAEVRKRVAAACEAAGIYMTGEVVEEIRAQDLIDTGNLLNSITHEMVASDRAKVGTNVFYSIYLEFGTRFMEAKAFMRRAMETGIASVQKLVQAIMAGGG